MDFQQLFWDFFGKSTTSSDTQTQSSSFYQSIYPESVRYALQYRKAELGKEEMTALLISWEFEVVYLLIKALAYNREYQRQFLEDLTRLYYRRDWTKDELRDLLKCYIDRLDDDVTVKGTKLAQLSRSGTQTWQDKWRSLVESVAHNEPHALPCIIAHTPIYAWHHFVEVYRDCGLKKLLLIMPTWMMDPEEDQMGYEIQLSERSTVNIQVRDECLYESWTCYGVDCIFQQRYCKEAIFIDDTINTATTAGKLQSFWLTEYGLSIPIERVRAITDLRDTQHVKQQSN